MPAATIPAAKMLPMLPPCDRQNPSRQLRLQIQSQLPLGRGVGEEVADRDDIRRR